MSTVKCNPDSCNAAAERSTEHDAAAHVAQPLNCVQIARTEHVAEEAGSTMRNKSDLHAVSAWSRRREDPRMAERPGQSFAAIDAPPDACALVNREGGVVAVFTRHGWSLFDAKDAQKANPRNLAVMRCSDGAVLYRFEGDTRRRGSWKLELRVAA